MSERESAGVGQDPAAQAATAHLLAARRDPTRFSLFYQQEHRNLFRYLHAHVLCPEVAADLTAESFAKALVGLRSFDPERGNGRQWLYGIARNEMRSWARDGKVSQRARRRAGVQTAAFTDLDEAGIESRIDAAELLERSRVAYEALDDDDRELVRMRVIDGLDYATIAQRAGCSVGAARVRACRALARLRADVLQAPDAPTPVHKQAL